MKSHLWLIRLIGVIVPRRLRKDWRQEWEAELRYREMQLTEWYNLNWRNKLALLCHSLGALLDALWLQPRRMEDEMFQDIRFGVRMLLKSRMFTIVIVLSLALGIGANTAVFSLINSMILKRLPVRAPEELVRFSIEAPVPERVRLGFPGPFGSKIKLSADYSLYLMIRDLNRSFTGVICIGDGGDGRLVVQEPGGGGAVETVRQQRVSGNFFSMLGVNAVVGRVLTVADDNPASAQPGAVISYEFWRRRFDLDPGVVGRKITVKDTPLTIVGVAPPGFSGYDIGRRMDIWCPIKAMKDENLNHSSCGVIGRLRPGLSLEQAQADLNLIFRQQLNEIADAKGAGWTQTRRREHFEQRISVESGSAGIRSAWGSSRRPLLILMITVALVLLIACLNIANLLLARAATRRKEIAVRLAVGASRLRLIRQLLTESVLLAALGGFAGLLFSHVCAQALLSYLVNQYETALDLSLDTRVLGFTLAISALTGLLFGLAPAWQATRLDLISSLKDQAGASAGRSRLRLNKLLVVAQVALSLLMLVGAGLFVRSLRNLRSIDAGINYKNIVKFRIDPGSSYDLTQRVNLQRQLLTRLEALPGAHSGSVSDHLPLSNATVISNVDVPGYAPQPDEKLLCHRLIVGPRFFETMKMPLLAGRDFGPQDDRPIPPAPADGSKTMGGDVPQVLISAVINQTMARHFFGNENPIGKRFFMKFPSAIVEIIGLVRDASFANVREQPPPTFYIYHFQQPIQFDVYVYLRTDGDADVSASSIQRLVRELDPQLRVYELQTMTEVVEETFRDTRFIADVSVAFSLFALLLACIGLYGVMSFAVTRRTSEIGIRMALGARAGDVVWLVMREILLLLALGIVIGLSAAMATTRLVSTLLFGLTPTDPLTITLATVLLIFVAALAGYLPARRAAHIDPLVALRQE